MADILVVDDEESVCSQIAGLLEDEGHEARVATGSETALEAVHLRQPALVILDVWLDGGALDGLQVLEILKRDLPSLQVLVISGHATIDTALLATRLGAYDFITKPFKADVLLHTVERALADARLRRENHILRESTFGASSAFISRSSAMQAVKKEMTRMAKTKAWCLLLGESGTGKTTVARWIHERSQRSSAPFVSLNCQGLSPDALALSLFGQEAHNDQPRRLGVLEEAHGGTLLLSNVSSLSLESQARIARPLYTQRFQRLHGRGWVTVDVRVLASSVFDLREKMREGLFQEDLFFRLAVLELTLPPLRERREDLRPLLEHIMGKLAASLRKEECSFSQGAILALLGHSWPGNLWELMNVTERLLLFFKGKRLTAEDVSSFLETPVLDVSSTMVTQAPLREARDLFEKQYLTFQLNKFSGNVSRTAEFVGLDRASLHRKLKKLSLLKRGVS